jgi:hypothetical protein
MSQAKEILSKVGGFAAGLSRRSAEHPLRLPDRDPDDGQTRSGGPKALAPAPGIELIPKVVIGVRFVDGEEQSQQAA